MTKLLVTLFWASCLAFVSSFSVAPLAVCRAGAAPSAFSSSTAPARTADSTRLYKLTKKRREELGVSDDEDEYDLYKALDANTDPLISKIVAGSLILVILSLLVVGVVIPSLTDYGEGVCNPLLTQGRC